MFPMKEKQACDNTGEKEIIHVKSVCKAGSPPGTW